MIAYNFFDDFVVYDPTIPRDRSDFNNQTVQNTNNSNSIVMDRPPQHSLSESFASTVSSQDLKHNYKRFFCGVRVGTLRANAKFYAVTMLNLLLCGLSYGMDKISLTPGYVGFYVVLTLTLIN